MLSALLLIELLLVTGDVVQRLGVKDVHLEFYKIHDYRFLLNLETGAIWNWSLERAWTEVLGSMISDSCFFLQVAGIIDSMLHNAMHVMKKVELGKQYWNASSVFRNWLISRETLEFW